MKKPLNKQREVQNQIFSYCEQVRFCIERFQNTFEECRVQIATKTIQNGFDGVHLAEGKADDIRRELEHLMYRRAVFPESRGDILGLVETMDRVPNAAESALRMIVNQHIILPPELIGTLLALVSICTKCVFIMLGGVTQVFSSFVDASITVGKIDELESEADRIEADLIDQVFTADYSDLQKILLRDLIKQISAIADRSENVGDRMRIIVAKRGI